MIDFGIIAAGDGNRIKEEGSLVSKPLVEIEGKPMIGRLISLMEECGANSVSVILNRDMPEVKVHLESLIPHLNCELKFFQDKTPSSMHSFYELVNVMNPSDKFVITTVDTIFRRDNFRAYIEHFINSPKNLDGLMGVTSFIDDEKPLYVETGEDDRIKAYKDNKEEGIKYVSAGVYGLKQNSLPILKECINSGVSRMRNFQRKLVENGLKLDAFDLGKVLDIDHLTDIEKANAFLV